MGSVASNASHAVNHLKDTASTARSSLVDLGVQAMKFLNSVRSQEVRAVDSVLGHIGWQRRESAVRPVWFFVAGAVMAGSVALILAPTSGKKLRMKIRDLLGVPKDSDGPKTGVKDVKSVEQRMQAPLPSNISEPSKPANGAGQPRVAQHQS